MMNHENNEKEKARKRYFSTILLESTQEREIKLKIQRINSQVKLNSKKITKILNSNQQN